ncbi:MULTISPECIES: hypothetical protein [unclassified Leisingera]|uniref:hypothetical protein n=1 Tax=unclassified Leisingera TaxID=2614906 RepID=UPI000803067B|nr:MULTISPECIES: hypothetical protein [unclassified Leisingera]MDC0660264.1 hypothetical protein [Leisingera sp. SS27]NVK15383.1 hypothetical protein [Paracoccaceae bacterium]OBY28230.1 hypothetical protein A9D60_11980 [Leisingera sp. JC1]UWQ77660.1 hypothetical protein K3725_10025 [Leisingera sp. S132]
MTREDLLSTVESLETRIRKESGAARLAMRPEFIRLLDYMRKTGAEVPGRLRRLEATLCEEAVEDMFDNVPV